MDSESRILNENDERFYVETSTLSGSGYGLFAKEPLKEGDRLAAIGVLIERNSIADHCTQYADSHKFRAGDYLLIPVGFAGMVNHSPTPNMRKIIENKNKVYLQAIRNVAAGEEIFFTYSEYAQERFGLRSGE